MVTSYDFCKALREALLAEQSARLVGNEGLVEASEELLRKAARIHSVLVERAVRESRRRAASSPPAKWPTL